MPQKNDLVQISRSQRFREWWCKKFSCITIGPYYGMVQSHCRRCGHKNKGIASEDCPEWSKPWGPFFK